MAGGRESGLQRDRSVSRPIRSGKSSAAFVVGAVEAAAGSAPSAGFDVTISPKPIE